MIGLLLIVAVALGVVLLEGKAIRPERAAVALLLAPFFAYLAWIRWNWASSEGRAKRAAKRENSKQ